MKPKTVLILFSIFIIQYLPRGIIFCFLFLWGSILNSQPGWIQNYDPFFHPAFTTGYEVGNILLTENGDYVVNGTCNKYNDWESYEFGYLMKTDIEGNIVWAEIDSVSADPWLSGGDSWAFAVLPDGGYVSAGRIWPDPSYLLFRDSEGNITNEKLYYDLLNYRSMVVDHDNNSLIIAGSQINVGAMLQKTDLSGNQIWLQTYDEFNAVESVIRTIEGGYALGGYYDDDDFILAKIDSDGILQWYNSYDYNSQMEWLNSIIQTSDGGYLLCGRTHLPGGNDNGGFLVKTNSIGDTLWTRKYDDNSTITPLENIDGFIIWGFDANGSRILQLDENGNILWFQQIPDTNYYSSSSERCFQKTSDNGYIVYLDGNWHVDSNFCLIKTDENGIVSANHNIIVHLNNENLFCYPNPFNANININFLLKNEGNICVGIFNIKGQLVKTLVNEFCKPGNYTIYWDGTNKYNQPLSSGIYLISMKRNHKIHQIKKINLLK